MSATYSDMQARIADEIIRTDLTSEIQLEILSAIKHYERQRFWFNEGQATASTVASTPNLAVPTDLLEIDALTITYNGHPYELNRRSWGWYRAIHGDDINIGKTVPTDYAYFANQLWLYPVPDTAYVLTKSYLKQLTALSSGSDSNEWTISGEELIRSRAKSAVLIRYVKDPIALGEHDAMRGSDYLSSEEKIAHESLIGTGIARTSTGFITPTQF